MRLLWSLTLGYTATTGRLLLLFVLITIEQLLF
jgi:hypothetical protein